MRIYLDMCALKRPFDDQTQDRVASETRAVLAIVRRLDAAVDTFVWSTALTFENAADPDEEVRDEVGKCAALAASSQGLTTQVKVRLMELAAGGLAVLDAAHVAFAEAAGCDFLITCDDRFMKRASRLNCWIRVLNPIEYLQEVGDVDRTDR